MGVGKKSVLGVDVADQGLRLNAVFDVSDTKAGIGLTTGCVSELIFKKLKYITLIIDTVGRNPVIAIVAIGHSTPVIPLLAPALETRRYTY